jgi:cell fate regulator YaaT (PSP1 superfamily)
MDQQQPFVVGVRFSVVGKIYHFEANKVPDLRVGDSVIVETSRGWQLGQVAQIVSDPHLPSDGEWKPVDRRATPRDLLLRQSWQNRELEVTNTARGRARELRLDGVKVVAAEYSFDGSRLAIMYSTETEEKVDLKSLRSEMQKNYAPAQVEMRQIGPRDVAKILGGMGACGLEQRCCSKFLTDFSSISIRMAKEQGISLTPTEITGMCGRLRCCLIYEYDQYVEARANLPKKNKRMITPQGEGKVIDVFPLREGVLVEIPEVGYREFHKDELKPAEEYEAFEKKAQSPCGGPDGKGCDCGKGGAEAAPADVKPVLDQIVKPPETKNDQRPAAEPRQDRQPRQERQGPQGQQAQQPRGRQDQRPNRPPQQDKKGGGHQRPQHHDNPPGRQGGQQKKGRSHPKPEGDSNQE